jgi:hypothetical protein
LNWMGAETKSLQRILKMKKETDDD